MEFTDEQLLNGLAKGDNRCVKYMYDTTFQLVVQFIKGNRGTLEDAEDIFQEALIVLYRKQNSQPIQLESKLRTYLIAVCKYIWYNRVRSRQYMDTIENKVDYGDEPEIIEGVEQSDRFTLYKKYFNELSDKCREILDLHFQDKSMAEITDLLGFTSIGYARKRKFQCKEKLIQAIKADVHYQKLKSRSVKIKN